MQETKPFECSKCGCCCYHVDTVLKNIETINGSYGVNLDFPYSHENGKCENLKDNMCAVYENRPVVCNVLEFAKLVSKHTGRDIDDILEQNRKGCRLARIKCKQLN